MVYIDFLENREDLLKSKEKKYFKLIKSVLINFRKFTNYINIVNTEYGKLIKVQKINNKTLKKIENLIKIDNIKIICPSSKIQKCEEILNFFKENNIKVVNGKWINNYLLYQLIEFISDSKDERMSEQEISLLINKNNYLINKNIYKIGIGCKNLNIITKNPGQFKNIDKKLLDEEGISLNIGNNYKKSLLNSNIIINIDYTGEELNKFNIPKYCCIININDENIRINKKSFEGINILSYKYNCDKKYIEEFKNFENNILYESIISRNSNQENVFVQLEKDNVNIVEVYGKNGAIRKKEFCKLKRININ